VLGGLAFEVAGAMRALGYSHATGRPMPGDPKPSVQQVTEEVLGRLRRNPWCRELDIDDAEVARLVRRTYLDVAPWPFDALLG